jgi:hypothetical protein
VVQDNKGPAPFDAEEKIIRLSYLIDLYSRDIMIYTEWYESSKAMLDKTRKMIELLEEEINEIKQGQLPLINE